MNNRRPTPTDLHGVVTFMPDATRGVVRGLTSEQLHATGTSHIVVNTLHMLISPGADTVAQLGGVHKFMNWPGLILSDSGGFQVFSLLHTKKWEGKIHHDGATFKSPRDGTTYELTPEKSIDIQMKLGTDILVVLDDCRKAETSREEAEVSVKNTIQWAERCKAHYLKYPSSERKGKFLTSVVQGANFNDLREKCANALVDIGFDGYNFGGYVLDDSGELVVEQLKCVVENTPKGALKYAMGVGKPEDILACAKLGYTLFDTVLPTRNARHGTLYSTDTDDGVLRIGNSQYSTDTSPIDSKCNCEACQEHTRAYIHQLLKNNEITGMSLATIHNLTFFQRYVNAINENISDLMDISHSDILRIMN